MQSRSRDFHRLKKLYLKMATLFLVSLIYLDHEKSLVIVDFLKKMRDCESNELYTREAMKVPSSSLGYI